MFPSWSMWATTVKNGDCPSKKTAMSAMKRVLRTGQKVVLAPMTPAERRLGAFGAGGTKRVSLLTALVKNRDGKWS